MILDRESQTPVPFKFNKVQEKYYESLFSGEEPVYPNQEGIREIILKARQQGFSSFILALFATDFLTRPYSISICISHRKDSTELLFKKVRFYIESYLKRLAETQGIKFNQDVMREFFQSDSKGMIENAMLCFILVQLEVRSEAEEVRPGIFISRRRLFTRIQR